MTIFLPQAPPLFRKAFDDACDRIFESNHDEVFYALLVQLIGQIREHPFFKDIISQIETEFLSKKLEFSKASLDYHEYNWKQLWQYHRRNYRLRKELARIKRIVTCPREILSSALHIRICFAMLYFRNQSPFFRFINDACLLFRKAQSDMRIGVTLTHHASQSRGKMAKNCVSLKFKRGDKLSKIPKAILTFGKQDPRPFRSRPEPISSLFSRSTQDLQHKFGIPGQNNDQKRRNMEIMAETNFRCCWERHLNLEQCYKVSPKFPSRQNYLAKWSTIRDKAWEAAWKRCEEEEVQFAHMAFRQNLSTSSNDSVAAFLPIERQIHRKDYESFLRSLKNHVHAYLPSIENEVKSVGEASELTLSGTLKGNFVTKLALEFWKKYPIGKRDDAFEYYLCKCPHELLLGRDRWDQIIRKSKLDPRPTKERKRGPGKKTCRI